MEQEADQSADFYQLLAWLHANRKRLISIAVGILVIAAVIGIYFWYKDYRETAANDALSKLATALNQQGEPVTVPGDEFVKVADDYSGTDAAGRALLLGGSALFKEGKYEAAQRAFDRFVEQYSSSPMAPEALFGIGASFEAQGKTQDAITRYEDLVKHQSQNWTSAETRSALARCYETINKPEMAAVQYEEMLRANGNDTWTAEARMQLQELLAKYPSLAKQPVAPKSGTEFNLPPK